MRPSPDHRIGDLLSIFYCCAATAGSAPPRWPSGTRSRLSRKASELQEAQCACTGPLVMFEFVLDDANLVCLWAFGALGDVELDSLVLVQRAVAI